MVNGSTRIATREKRFGAPVAWLSPGLHRAAQLIETAWRRETALRRPFLWTPVGAGAGVLLYFAAAREPSLLLCLAALIVPGALAVLARRFDHLRPFLVALTLIAAGYASAAWRTARVAAPVLPRIGIGELTGFVEELDPRPNGARFILRVASAEGLPEDVVPFRVRLTTRNAPHFSAGDFIALKARLMPPARAALPDGYDFARDAYFMRIGGVGGALGRIEIMTPPEPAPLALRFFAQIDRYRNALARRVYEALDGDAGAIAAAMVTGKRDFLSEKIKDLIRRAGIFHIITISGMQMTLVAGIFFVGLRRALALSQTLALTFPIKKWAAALAMIGAIFYDLFTGSRIGTERALVMTLIMLLAVLVDRPALSMRNLAFAALFVILFEPEALLGASFQLSFAAVVALIAVYEWRGDFVAQSTAPMESTNLPGVLLSVLNNLAERLLHGPGFVLVATLCATSATASFMAADFHEISPFVLIGNPLTLLAIEFFAVPCALIGAALYPFGLDGFVWRYLEIGINLVISLAGLIASAPGASLHVKSFAPWALVFLALAVMSLALWRTTLFRASAAPLLLLGLIGARSGVGFDVAIAPTGDAAALRLPSGQLALLGKHPGAFAAEQWLRADADERAPLETQRAGVCDELGCAARTSDGRAIALVLERSAFLEDCARAQLIVTPLRAPEGCAASIVIDRRTLAQTGAITLRFKGAEIDWRSARAMGEDRPWSPAPTQQQTRMRMPAPEADDAAQARSVLTED